MTHVVEPSRRIGRDAELVAAPRLDNQLTCYAGVQALLARRGRERHAYPAARPLRPRGGRQPVRPRRDVHPAAERPRADRPRQRRRPRGLLARPRPHRRRLRRHGPRHHPNYPDRHEPQHPIAIDGGPVLKVNTSLRYATDSLGAAAFALACEQAGVPMQRYVVRSDLPSGGTVGPMTAADHRRDHGGLRCADPLDAQLARALRAPSNRPGMRRPSPPSSPPSSRFVLWTALEFRLHPPRTTEEAAPWTRTS